MRKRRDTVRKMLGSRGTIQNLLVRWVTVMTLGSGIVNLWSASSPGLPQRMRVLHGLFPLEFLHISNSLTMIFGFGLIVSSLNVARKKRRAFNIVLAMASLSIVFHLTKGLDYEEALFSAVLVGFLLLSRKSFRVSSRAMPSARQLTLRIGVGAFVAAAYSLSSYWSIAPPWEHWFYRSIHVMAFTFVIYVFVLLYRPVKYRFRAKPQDRAHATEVLNQYGRATLDFFKIAPDKSFFFSDSGRSFVAFGVANNFAVVLGDPAGPAEEFAELIRKFSEYCRLKDWGLAFHQVTPEVLDMFRQQGFRRFKVGDEAIVDLTAFTLEGKAGKDVRTKFKQLEKMGIHVVRYSTPIPNDVLQQLKAVSDEWLRIPGRRERAFTLGHFDPDYLRSTPVLAAVDGENRILAFVNLVPSYKKGETTIDLMRRRTDAPNGIMDYLFGKLFIELKNDGYQRFNLGMAPMSGFQQDETASTAERVIHQFCQRLNFVFSFSGLHAYKAKFASFWEPRYIVYRNITDLPRVALALGKVTTIKGCS
jgi:phosphatidylglycerol lysyltransferase